MNSAWSSPNKTLYGSGTAKTVGSHLQQFGCHKVIIVYDQGVFSAGLTERITASIRDAGIDYICYDGALSDAPDYTINEGAELGRREQVDGVVAVGGGSAIDTGKGICVLLSNPPPINRYFARPGMPQVGDTSNLKPIIVLPTTAGTGSEVTPGGAVADTENNTKENFICPVTLGIVDPELTLGLPPFATIATGMDALCHSTEAFVSNEPNHFSDLLAKQAITLIGKNLPTAVKDGSNLAAREGMHLAATLGAMSILGPYCNIGHDIGAVLCMEFHIPHGIAVSLCLPEILQFISPAVPGKLAELVVCMGSSVPEDASPEEIGQIAYTLMASFMKEIGYPPFSQFITSKQQLLTAVPKVMETQNFHFSPRPVTSADVEQLLSSAYDRSCGN